MLLLEQIYTKNYQFWRFGGGGCACTSPHFQSHNGEVWREGADLGQHPHI